MDKTGRFNLIIGLLLILGSLTALTLEQVNTTSSQALTNKTLVSPTISSPTLSGTATGTYTLGGTPTISGATLSTATLSSPALSGTVTGTYTLGGTPTISSPAISSPVLSGTSTGTYTLAGTPTISSALTLSSGQLAFPATQNASAGANTLDDYEEGTCTLSLGGTATYTTRTCHYTKIGRSVTIHFNIAVNAIGTGSTNTITYSAGPPAVASEGAGIGACLWANGAVSPVNLNAYAFPSTSTIVMRGNTAGAASDGTLNIFGGSTSVLCSLTYMAS